MSDVDDRGHRCEKRDDVLYEALAGRSETLAVRCGGVWVSEVDADAYYAHGH